MAESQNSPSEQKDTQARQVAYRVRVTDIQSGQFVQQEGWSPSFVKVGEWQVSRIHLTGVLVDLRSSVVAFAPIDRFFAVIDDGSATIQLRAFDPITVASDLSTGDTVRVVGRVKKYQDNVYIVPEIIKRIRPNPHRKTTSSSQKTTLESQPSESHTESPLKKNVPQEVSQPVTTTAQTLGNKTLDIIEKLDTGDGAIRAMVLDEFKSIGVADPEKKLHSLLLSGDCYEIRPDRIKVLK